MSRRLRIYFARFAVFLDGLMIRHAHRIPGVAEAGVFYRGQLPFLSAAMWTERRTFTLQVAWLEVVMDRK